jgi:hypothetical protein
MSPESADLIERYQVTKREKFLLKDFDPRRIAYSGMDEPRYVAVGSGRRTSLMAAFHRRSR